MTKLQRFSEHIWTVFYPMKIAGIPVGTRATIVRLPSKGLVIVSPVPFDDETAQAIEELGAVDTIVAPSLLHHLYFGDACRRWSDARALVAPGLDNKTDLADRAVALGDTGSIEDTVYWRKIDGAPKLTEHVFVDPRDGVLILTDLAFNYRHHERWWMRMALRAYGVYGRFGPSRLVRWLIADDKVFGDSIAALFDHPWDAVIVSHGECVEKGGRRLFADAFSDYLPGDLEVEAR